MADIQPKFDLGQSVSFLSSVFKSSKIVGRTLVTFKDLDTGEEQSHIKYTLEVTSIVTGKTSKYEIVEYELEDRLI